MARVVVLERHAEPKAFREAPVRVRIGVSITQLR